MESERIYRIVLSVAEHYDSLCMDNAPERETLARAVAAALGPAPSATVNVAGFPGKRRADGTIHIPHRLRAPYVDRCRHEIWAALPMDWSVEDDDNGEGFVCTPPNGNGA